MENSKKTAGSIVDIISRLNAECEILEAARGMAVEKQCHEMAGELAEKIRHSTQIAKELDAILDKTEVEIPAELFISLPPQ